MITCTHYHSMVCVFFFFNDTATTEIYTLSLHDALPICSSPAARFWPRPPGRAPQETHHIDALLAAPRAGALEPTVGKDRKSTRLNSSHANISYAVFCLKKKNKTRTNR